MNQIALTGTARLCLAAGLGMTLCAAPRILAAQTAVPPVKTLSPGTCPEVTTGDILTLEWNPAFDKPFAVTGLSELHLWFATAGREAAVKRSHNSLTLSAIHVRGAGDPVAYTQNGFYRLQFVVNTESLEPGEYHLADAAAYPQVHPRYPDETPQMTHSPTSLPFCLNVVPSTTRHR